MKKLFLGAFLISIGIAAQSQTTADILKQQAGQGVKEGVKEGANVATQKTADMIVSKLLGKKNKKKKNTVDNNNNNTNTDTNVNNNNNNNVGTPVAGANKTADDKTNGEVPSLKTYSKYDFVPGEKILAFDNFSKDAIGDFPVSWNTNSSGEVVTSTAGEGHWLMFTKQGKFIPEYITDLPDNFTFEYDIVSNEKYNSYGPPLTIYFLTGKGGKDVFDNWFMVDGNRSGIKLSVHPTSGNNSGMATIETFDNGKSVVRNDVNTSQFSTISGKGLRSVHVSIWRQKQRVRVYLNEEKVYDLPRAFPENKTYTTTFFEIYGDFKDQDRYLLGNMKLAVGNADTRNKLMNEGKFSTTGILFDVNSDKIKPESYGVLKEIAEVLKDNPSVRVTIIGHTDSDGDADYNLKLSKQRADAVKAVLGNEFDIDASRMSTDGKGATQPVGNNKTEEGKAQNRRVEFVKQ